MTPCTTVKQQNRLPDLGRFQLLMNTDEDIRDFDPERLQERLRAAKGKAIYDIVHRSNNDAKELYERKGRVFAFNTVLYYLRNEPEKDIDEETEKMYRALAEADEAVFEDMIVEDETDDTEPVDLNNEVY